MPQQPASLRQALRDRTGPRHDALDAAMGALDLAKREDYIRFLTIQHTARSGIEAWLTRNAPSDLTPPVTTDLIAQDLRDLGAPVPEFYTFPGHGLIPASALGMAWTLAGSSLGNRSMLADHRKTEGDDLKPAAFLSDKATGIYFKKLLSRLDRPATPNDHYVFAGADAVFGHFLGVVGTHARAHAA